MRQTVKTALLIFVLSALALHFFFVFVNCAPAIHKSHRLFFWSQRYAYPFFQQTWQLFAPPPDANYQLVASYELSGKQCTDIFNEVLFRHQTNRLAGYEPLFLCFASSIHQFEKNALWQGLNNGEVKSNTAFGILEKLCRAYIVHTQGAVPNQLKITLVVKPTNGQPTRIYYN